MCCTCMSGRTFEQIHRHVEAAAESQTETPSSSYLTNIITRIHNTGNSVQHMNNSWNIYYAHTFDRRKQELDQEVCQV